MMKNVLQEHTNTPVLWIFPQLLSYIANFTLIIG